MIPKNVPSLPILRSAKGSASTATLIVELVASEGEKTVGDVHKLLFERFRYQISYQGVRKVALHLVEEGVLQQEAGTLSLNRHWLLQARSALDRLIAATSPAAPRGSRHLVSAEGFDVYRAASLFAADTLWGELLLQVCEESKSRTRKLLSLNHYAFWMPINLGRETELYAKLLHLGWKIEFLFSRHSPLNDWAIDIHRAAGVKSYITPLPSIPESTYYNVIAERLIEVTLDPALAKLAKVLASKGPGKLSAKDVHKLAHTSGEVIIRVFRNQVLADSLQNMSRVSTRG